MGLSFQIVAAAAVLQARIQFHSNAYQMLKAYVDNAFLKGWRIYKDRALDQVDTRICVGYAVL